MFRSSVRQTLLVGRRMRSVRTAEHKIWYGPSGTTEVDLTLVFAARFACPTSSQSTARVAYS